MRIVADNRIPFLKDVLEAYGEVIYLDGEKINNKSLRNADALIVRTRTRCNKELLAGTNIRFVGTTTIGTDHIDTAWCDKVGIKWASAPGCNSSSVMQYISSALIYLAEKHNIRLSDKTLGIVGVGNIGARVEKMARVLGIRVLLNDPPRERVESETKFVTLERLKAESDIISFHVPLTKSGQDKTLNLADEDFFNGLKKGCIIINSSRGGVIDEKLLIKEIHSGNILGTVLDVWAGEPNINIELLKLCDIATPHIAGYSDDGKYNATKKIVEEFTGFFGFDFYPENIIKPASIENQQIVLSENEAFADQLRRGIYSSYKIFDDAKKLTDNPANFESIRNSYRSRREFSAYKISGEGPALQTLLDLGFSQ